MFGLSKHEGPMFCYQLHSLLIVGISIKDHYFHEPVHVRITLRLVHIAASGRTSAHVPKLAKYIGYKYFAVDSILKTSVSDAINMFFFF